MPDLCPRAESVAAMSQECWRTTTSQHIELTPLWQPLGADDDMHLAERTEFRAWAIIGCMTQSVDVDDLCGLLQFHKSKFT